MNELINVIMPASAGILFMIQSAYHWGLYRKLYTHAAKEKAEGDTPPLSIVLTTKDAAMDLEKNLPFILEQDYPEFEVIVVYDQEKDNPCVDALKRLENKYPNLRHTFIPDTARYISRKKLGITMAIKASRYDWLVFTEPNCRPASNQWLRKLARNFTPGTDIVLGYSNYEKTQGWFNRKATFDTLLHAMRYLGSAIGGNPYMGCGRNLAYRKEVFYRQKGFASHLNLSRGEDDLFINQIANGRNTCVEAHPESIVRITPPHLKKSWKEEKINYMMTSRYFHGTARFWVGFETCSRLLFFLSVVACLVYGIWMKEWWTVGIAAGLWLVRFIQLLAIFRKTSMALNERRFYTTLWLFDWMQPLWNLRFKLLQRTRKKDEFLRK